MTTNQLNSKMRPVSSDIDHSSTVLTIIVLLGFATIIHAPFHFGNLYGEQDAARLVNDALIWLTTGVRSESLSEYRFYVSPGYIWLAKQAVLVAKATSVHPAFYLNTLNVLAAILIVIPIFLLFTRLVGHEGALLGTIFLSLVPTFWQSGLYGFPHLLSMLFMATALLAYDRYLTSQAGKVTDLLLVILLLTISIFLKADIYLSTIVLFGLIIYRRRFSLAYLLSAGVMVIVPIILSLATSHGLLANSPTPIDYLTKWNTQWPVAPGRLFWGGRIDIVMMSMGQLSILVFFASLVFLLVTKRYSLALLLSLWLVVPLSFWVFRAGDTARHHFQASLPVALGIGVLLGSLRWKSVRYASLLGLILVNYFSFMPSSSTVRTSGNLAQSGRMIKARAAQYHEAAHRYAEADGDNKVILGGLTNPYVDNEILYRAQTVESVKRLDALGYETIEIRYTAGGKPHVSTSVRVRLETLRAAADLYQRAGYRVYSIEYDLRSNQEQVGTGDDSGARGLNEFVSSPVE